MRRLGSTNPANQPLDGGIAAAEALLPHQGRMDGSTLDTLGHPRGDAFLMLPETGETLGRLTIRAPL